MKLLQLYHVEEKFIHPMYTKYVGTGVAGSRGGTPATSMKMRKGGGGDEHIIEEFMNDQVDDEMLVPLSQDEYDEGDDEHEEDYEYRDSTRAQLGGNSEENGSDDGDDDGGESDNRDDANESGADEFN